MAEADKGRLMTMIGVSGWMFLLVPTHLGCAGQSPVSRKMVVVLVVFCSDLRFSWNRYRVTCTRIPSASNSLMWLIIGALWMVLLTYLLRWHTICLVYENMTSSTKPKIHNITPSEEDWATSTGNMHKKSVKLGRRFLRCVSGQTVSCTL